MQEDERMNQEDEIKYIREGLEEWQETLTPPWGGTKTMGFINVLVGMLDIAEIKRKTALNNCYAAREQLEEAETEQKKHDIAICRETALVYATLAEEDDGTGAINQHELEGYLQRVAACEQCAKYIEAGESEVVVSRSNKEG